LAVCLVLAACVLSERDEALARAPMEAMRARDMTALYDMLSPELRNQETRATLEAMMAMVPETAPQRVRIVAWTATTNSAGRAIDTLALYEYPNALLEVRTMMFMPEGSSGAELQTFSVTPVDRAAAAANALGFNRMTGVHVAMLAGALIPLGLMIVACVAALRTRGLPAKWGFAILAFAGVGAAWLNWTTGEAGFEALSVNLIGVGLSRAPSPLAPWILHFTAPVGAIVVLALVQLHRARRGPA
jgi:hypothetical protein